MGAILIGFIGILLTVLAVSGIGWCIVKIVKEIIKEVKGNDY